MTQYWADAATENCVWLFQVWVKGAFPRRDSPPVGWDTEAVFLCREEARNHGMSRPWAWGEEGKGWRIYGVPLKGCAVRFLGEAGVDQKFIDEHKKINET